MLSLKRLFLLVFLVQNGQIVGMAQGPVYIFNASKTAIEIEEKRKEVPYTQKISLSPEKTWKIELIASPKDRLEPSTAQKTGLTPVYEITIYGPDKQEQTMSTGELISKMTECYEKAQTSAISIIIRAEEIPGSFPLYRKSYKFIKPEISCAGSKELLEKEWQPISPSGLSKEISIGEEEEINKEDREKQPGIMHDIQVLHPTLTQSQTFYDQLLAQSLEEMPVYFENEQALFSGKKQDNPLYQKVIDLVQIAKDEKFLAPNAQEYNPKSRIIGFQNGNSDVHLAHGYVHFYSNSYMTSAPDQPNLDLYMNSKGIEAQETAKQLVKNYKIHLMPEYNWNAIKQTTRHLLQVLMHNSELQKIIAGFKVRVAPLIVKTQSGSEIIMPLIVIYTFLGKDAAQKALDILYTELKGEKGLGVTPRHNVVVNDLIFVAQGDGQYKGGKYARFYELPREAYYLSGFTGTKQNYHLVHPETKKELL